MNDIKGGSRVYGGGGGVLKLSGKTTNFLRGSRDASQENFEKRRKVLHYGAIQAALKRKMSSI